MLIYRDLKCSKLSNDVNRRLIFIRTTATKLSVKPNAVLISAMLMDVCLGLDEFKSLGREAGEAFDHSNAIRGHCALVTPALLYPVLELGCCFPFEAAVAIRQACGTQTAPPLINIIPRFLLSVRGFPGVSQALPPNSQVE